MGPAISNPGRPTRYYGTSRNLVRQKSAAVGVAPSAVPDPPSERSSRPRVPLWKQPRFWLAVMVVGFFTISLYVGICAYTGLQTSNDTDAGIITQAVASTTLGHNVPFYESYDCIVKSRCSFIIVHPGFVLYAAVPFYDLVPATPTLMALRAALVAGAAIPLYVLTRRATASPGKGLLAAGLFLVWAPSMLGDAFSTHLESLLPIELFSLVALWQVGRYRLALAVALVSFLTFEVYPVFTFLVGAFFLFPYFDRWLRRRWRSWRSRSAARSARPSVLSRIRSSIGYSWKVRELRYILVLMFISAVAYVVLALWLNVWGYQVLGIRAPQLAPGLTGVFSDNSSRAPAALRAILTSPQTVTTAEYWLILYALVAFIPLLSPRALILSLPWIGWTFLNDSSRFSTIGHQYDLIAAAPLFIGLAYGLRRVPVSWPGSSAGVVEVASPPPAETPPTDRPRWRRPNGSGSMAWGGLLLVVIAANLILIPIDPLLPAAGFHPGGPFETNYFDHPLEIAPSYQWMEQLIGSVPHDATIAVDPSIMSLLADFPRAYEILRIDQQNLTNLPFNVSGGPQYVLLGVGTFDSLGANFSRELSDPAVYGLRGYVGSTSLGPVLLYEKGFTGAADVYGPTLPPVSATYDTANGLRVGPKGMVVSNSSSPSGSVIRSLNATDRAGLVWTGPDVFLPPANYTVRVDVAVSGANLTRNPSAPALRVEVYGYGPVLANVTYTAAQFPPGVWTTLVIVLSNLNPLPLTDVAGFLESDQFSVTLLSVSVEPSNT
jgi:uncharacterized membrane protein